jgi:hypothetical protein
MVEDSNRSTPEGKKWECCTACNGQGKVLVDDIPEVKRYPHPPSLERFLCMKCFFGLGYGKLVLMGSPEVQRRPGNNPFGPRGTLRCLACQRRKKKVLPPILVMGVRVKC